MGLPAQGAGPGGVGLTYLNNFNSQLLAYLLKAPDNIAVVPEVHGELVAVIPGYLFRVAYDNFTYALPPQHLHYPPGHAI
jgi:hypothetical protein